MTDCFKCCNPSPPKHSMFCFVNMLMPDQCQCFDVECLLAMQPDQAISACPCAPAGAPYLPLLPSFRALFPGVDPMPLVASVLFFSPIIRDFISWCGVRQVISDLPGPCPAMSPSVLPPGPAVLRISYLLTTGRSCSGAGHVQPFVQALRPGVLGQVAKRTFVRAMAERGSVILVPGGQAELVHTGRLNRNREFVIYPKHKGAQSLALSCVLGGVQESSIDEDARH